MSEDIIAVLTNPTVDVRLAGRVLGVGKNAAYKAAGDGTIPTITVAGRKRVPTAKLREMLGLPPHPPSRGAALIAA
jgi:hypothetical protein